MTADTDKDKDKEMTVCNVIQSTTNRTQRSGSIDQLDQMIWKDLIASALWSR